MTCKTHWKWGFPVRPIFCLSHSVTNEKEVQFKDPQLYLSQGITHKSQKAKKLLNKNLEISGNGMLGDFIQSVHLKETKPQSDISTSSYVFYATVACAVSLLFSLMLLPKCIPVISSRQDLLFTVWLSLHSQYKKHEKQTRSMFWTYYYTVVLIHFM